MKNGGKGQRNKEPYWRKNYLKTQINKIINNKKKVVVYTQHSLKYMQYMLFRQAKILRTLRRVETKWHKFIALLHTQYIVTNGKKLEEARYD